MSTGGRTPKARTNIYRAAGTILLALGFLALNLAWSITDPSAADADIGAGGLILLGRLSGSVGLLLVVLDVILGLRERASR